MTISERTVKKLWSVSGNQCAFPGCEQPLIDFDHDVVIGEMSHIHARSSGGPRNDAEMEEDEREAYSNLIVLCRNHHQLVDGAPDEFPADVLRQWKQKHESQSSEPRDLPPELLEEWIDRFQPSTLLVHVEPGDVESLQDVLEWTPSEQYPNESAHGMYPIVLTFDELKSLHGRLAGLYYSRGEPAYKFTTELAEEDVFRATSIVARITQSAIQYYQVEGSRRRSNLSDYER